MSEDAIIALLGQEAVESKRDDAFIYYYIRPPGGENRVKNWIPMRQCGIRYFVTEESSRIVDRNTIIRPRCEFEVRGEGGGWGWWLGVMIRGKGRGGGSYVLVFWECC